MLPTREVDSDSDFVADEDESDSASSDSSDEEDDDGTTESLEGIPVTSGNGNEQCGTPPPPQGSLAKAPPASVVQFEAEQHFEIEHANRSRSSVTTARQNEHELQPKRLPQSALVAPTPATAVGPGAASASAIVTVSPAASTSSTNTTTNIHARVSSVENNEGAADSSAAVTGAAPGFTIEADRAIITSAMVACMNVQTSASTGTSMTLRGAAFKALLEKFDVRGPLAGQWLGRGQLAVEDLERRYQHLRAQMDS